MIEKFETHWKADSHEDLREFLTGVNADYDHPATKFARVVCACGASVFSLRNADNDRAAERKCLACKKRHLMLDSEKRWDATRPAPRKCQCGAKDFDLVVSFGTPTPPDSVAVTIGTRCVACGTLGTSGHWYVAGTPEDALLRGL